MKNPGVWMRRTPTGLEANNPEAQAALAKIGVGERVLVKLHRSRNAQHHRMFWAVLSHVAQATHFETPERLLAALKLALGRYDLMTMPNGKVVPVLHSISFADMDQTEFARFYSDALNIICRDVLPGTSVEDLLEESRDQPVAA